VHLPRLAAREDTELAVVIDVDADRARETAERFGAPRHGTEVEVSVPPFIADLHYQPAPHVSTALEEAAGAAGSLDLTFGEQMSSFGTFLLRAESVASSRIERVNATMDDLAKAVVGVKASEGARATVAAVRALTTMVTSAGAKGRIDLDDLLAAHHDLMTDDPTDARYAGTLRDVQNWIGGSDYSPRGAVHVPPPPELVPELMADLIEFANRRDMTVLVQAAIARFHTAKSPHSVTEPQITPDQTTSVHQG